MYGAMDECISVNGIRTKCMGMVNSPGKMEESIMDTMKMIKNKVMAYLNGVDLFLNIYDYYL